ncbi:unnamed protein product [Caenorhabditis auriculariae]|uniref:Uncharacterized protein n=1 Tax=Caenorhabditis auriculariae TaxID=2777116 RepID=A0A8S1HKH6_9PELO|nr:unnamed protein product [Caenorhabditis auriculariae]
MLNFSFREAERTTPVELKKKHRQEVPVTAEGLLPMANIVLVTEPQPDSKWFGVYPPKIGLYAYLGLSALTAVFGLSQGQISAGALVGGLIFIEAFAIYRDHKQLLLLILVLLTISVVLLFFLDGFLLFLLILLSSEMSKETSGAELEKWNEAMRDMPLRTYVVVIAMGLLLSIHIWVLTRKVYEHAKRKHNRQIAYATVAEAPILTGKDGV